MVIVLQENSPIPPSSLLATKKSRTNCTRFLAGRRKENSSVRQKFNLKNIKNAFQKFF